MQLSHLFFGYPTEPQASLVRQMGVRYAIAKLAPDLTGDEPPYDFGALKRAKYRFADAGFELIGLEGDQFDMNRIKFGAEGRDEDLERYGQMLASMGRLGIRLLCYNFMAGIGWYRTQTNVAERGGALVSGFDADYAQTLPLTDWGNVSEAQIWSNYTQFIRYVLPIAEQAGVQMALHPDDPPVSPLRGIGRIFTSADGIRRALSLSDSPSHGLTFCQGTYTTMGEDVPALIQEWQHRIRFVHIRDVAGTRENFRETFHDNGPTDMAAMLRCYRDSGFNGPIRSDHVPTMAGEDNTHAGYGMLGNLFGIGYIRGLMDAIGIPTEKSHSQTTSA
ncbi:mannonate dehydratase [Spirosoma montaniterrae]|uniref:mannonate dehydratase n=1 Tax=Spirosoma montaniterrae TaxID=1178516 RepID=A0A1P9WV19_9BACT|nr:mannonate dehydratase [Spirosoma montaniterrae]AQG79188.1 mannonate dehydratase [Spirosoma montaniterrae]